MQVEDERRHADQFKEQVGVLELFSFSFFFFFAHLANI